jgi:hypothetical protein
MDSIKKKALAQFNSYMTNGTQQVQIGNANPGPLCPFFFKVNNMKY